MFHISLQSICHTIFSCHLDVILGLYHELELPKGINILLKIPRILISLLWLTWTIILCFLMLSPSDGTVKSLSGLFGGKEITDAIGHVILIGADCVLLYLLLSYFLSQAIAQRSAVIVTLILGIILESAQLWIPSRGASLIDILAAGIGVGLALLFISKFHDSDVIKKSFRLGEGSI